MSETIAVIGVGEAGSAFVSGWEVAEGRTVRAYDIKSDIPATAPVMAERYAALGLTGCASAREAVERADLVICTVTADQAVAAAEAAAPHLRAGAFWCDCNSCAPSSKRAAAEVIENAGARYVDVAVMSPVHPKGNLAPLLLSGPHAAAVAPVLSALPMAPRVVDGPVGAASSIKMIRSVMVKGLEALTAECLLAAVAAGVEEEVLDSLYKSHPGPDWRARSAYNLERSLTHGARRAAEMEEVVKTLSDLQLPSAMAAATVGWQERMAASGVTASHDEPAREIAARVLDVVRKAPPRAA